MEKCFSAIFPRCLGLKIFWVYPCHCLFYHLSNIYESCVGTPCISSLQEGRFLFLLKSNSISHRWRIKPVLLPQTSWRLNMLIFYKPQKECQLCFYIKVNTDYYSLILKRTHWKLSLPFVSANKSNAVTAAIPRWVIWFQHTSAEEVTPSQ